MSPQKNPSKEPVTLTDAAEAAHCLFGFVRINTLRAANGELEKPIPEALNELKDQMLHAGEVYRGVTNDFTTRFNESSLIPATTEQQAFDRLQKDIILPAIKELAALANDEKGAPGKYAMPGYEHINATTLLADLSKVINGQFLAGEPNQQNQVRYEANPFDLPEFPNNHAHAVRSKGEKAPDRAAQPSATPRASWATPFSLAQHISRDTLVSDITPSDEEALYLSTLASGGKAEPPRRKQLLDLLRERQENAQIDLSGARTK